jgi:hypothetical protein
LETHAKTSIDNAARIAREPKLVYCDRYRCPL